MGVLLHTGLLIARPYWGGTNTRSIVFLPIFCPIRGNGSPFSFYVVLYEGYFFAVKS